MTNSVKRADDWRTVHLVFIWTVAGIWTAGIGALAIWPQTQTTHTRGIALGIAALLPHLWLGRSIWHCPDRKGIGIPMAILIGRFFSPLILLSVLIWQFPLEKRIIAYTSASLIIVFISIESFLFCKGVERL